MKKLPTILLLTGSGLMILDGFDFVHSLTLFLLAGIIPGTNTSISPIDMMAAFATAFTIVVLRITYWPSIKNLFFSDIKKPSTKQTAKQN